MDKVKFKLRADEFRLVHDLLNHLLAVLSMKVGANLNEQNLRLKSDFVLLQRIVQKKMAAKMVMLKKENNLNLTLDESIAFYVQVNRMDIGRLDDFSGAVVCAINSEIERFLLCQKSAKRTGT